jgi:hypothetical protein
MAAVLVEFHFRVDKKQFEYVEAYLKSQEGSQGHEVDNDHSNGHDEQDSTTQALNQRNGYQCHQQSNEARAEDRVLYVVSVDFRLCEYTRRIVEDLMRKK